MILITIIIVLLIIVNINSITINNNINVHSSNNVKSNEIMMWMCLERCDDNASNITNQLNQIEINKSSFKSISFELYNLGPNSTLMLNNLTEVASSINAMGIETFAMVSSYPYPPEFIDYMRQVFEKPQPFIDSCIIAAKENSLTGFNIDWEPVTDDVTPDDASNYATFLNTFALEMHKHGLRVSVDVGTWSAIWNLTAISNTAVDQIITMNTYTNKKKTWIETFNNVIDIIPKDKLVIGLESDIDLSDSDLILRFDELRLHNIKQIALWRSPVPVNWWPYINEYLKF